jgi:hypothetical protein
MSLHPSYGLRATADESLRPSCGLWAALVPGLPRSVMDVEYFDGVAGYAIENPVGIAAQRRHANVRAAGGAA